LHHTQGRVALSKKCCKSTCKFSRQQKQVLEFLLLGRQFWLISLSVHCSVHINVGGLLQRALQMPSTAVAQLLCLRHHIFHPMHSNAAVVSSFIPLPV
jgi:hypothetical protein